MSRFGVDLTACWRRPVGMVTASLELTRALLAQDEAAFTLFCSRERPAGLDSAPARAILSPHRHELANKLAWMPWVEAEAGLDAMLYPYWPSPPRRLRRAPPAVVVIHDLAYRVRPAEVPWQQRLYLGSLVPAALRSASAVLVPSQATGRDLLEHYPLPDLEERLVVVPEGPSRLGEVPAGLPPGLEPGFVLAIGTVEHRKNHARLLAAHRLLRARLGTELPPLVVAGRAGWAVAELVRELQTEPDVLWLGHVPAEVLLGLYTNAAVLAFPSLYEGFGLPLLDAMVLGLPALIGGRGALPELAGGAALAVDPEDVEAIAAGLERLLSDTRLRSELVGKGRLRAAAFSWDSAARATGQVLSRIASARLMS